MKHRHLKVAAVLIGLAAASAPPILSGQMATGEVMPDGRSVGGVGRGTVVPKTVVIRGQVIDLQGLAMSQVLVQLYAVAGPLMAEETTNASGAFTFRLTSAGPYEVRLNYRGVTSYTQIEGDNEVVLRFDPAPDAIQLMASSSSTVSVNDLQATQRAKNRMVEALRELQKHDYDRAFNVVKEVIAADPNWNRGYQLRGVLEMVEGNYSAAIDDLNTAIKLNSHNNGALTALGKSYGAIGRYDLAAASLQQALNIAPVMWPTYIEMASLDLHRGNNAEALKMAKSAQFTTPPGPAEAHFLEAVAADKSGDLGTAALEYTSFVGTAISTPSNVQSIIYARQRLTQLPPPAARPPAAGAGGTGGMTTPR